MSRTCCFAPSTVCDRLCFGTIILGNQCDNIPICSSSNHSLMARCLLAYLLSIALTVVVPIDRYWIVPSNHHRFMCLFYPSNLFNVGTRRVDLCFYGEFYFQRAWPWWRRAGFFSQFRLFRYRIVVTAPEISLHCVLLPSLRGQSGEEKLRKIRWPTLRGWYGGTYFAADWANIKGRDTIRFSSTCQKRRGCSPAGNPMALMWSEAALEEKGIWPPVFEKDHASHIPNAGVWRNCWTWKFAGKEGGGWFSSWD